MKVLERLFAAWLSLSLLGLLVLAVAGIYDITRAHPLGITVGYNAVIVASVMVVTFSGYLLVVAQVIVMRRNK